MVISGGASAVFGWFVNLTAVGGFIGWGVMNWTYLRFCTSTFFFHGRALDSHSRIDYGYEKQGFNRKELLYYSPFQPYLSWWGIFWATFFVIISGLHTWFKWDTSVFFTYCGHSFSCFRTSSRTYQPLDIDIALVLGLYFGYKVIKKTKIRKWEEMDFVTGIPTPEETEIPEVPPRNVWGKIASIVF